MFPNEAPGRRQMSFAFHLSFRYATSLPDASVSLKTNGLARCLHEKFLPILQFSFARDLLRHKRIFALS